MEYSGCESVALEKQRELSKKIKILDRNYDQQGTGRYHKENIGG